MPKLGPDGKLIRLFADKDVWAEWLEKNHGASSGIWLRLAKKASKRKSVSYDDALEVALCYGWIDGMVRREDDDFSLQKFTPRAKKSIWSKRNRERALGLIRSGKMRPSGLAEVERAKNDGRWDAAYDPATTIQVPDDLRAALQKDRNARDFFESLDSQNRYAILFRLQTASNSQARAKRLETFVEMLKRHEKLHP